MTLPAPPAAECLTLADRFHVLVLDITEQLGWEQDELGFAIFRAAGRLTSRTAAAVSIFIPEHRAIHRDEALAGLHDCRLLLEHIAGIRSMDHDTVTGALRHLQALERLLDPDSAGPPVRATRRHPAPNDPALALIG
jgi:hypothetical protein